MRCLAYMLNPFPGEECSTVELRSVCLLFTVVADTRYLQ